jgi:hypothetical protein
MLALIEVTPSERIVMRAPPWSGVERAWRELAAVSALGTLGVVVAIALGWTPIARHGAAVAAAAASITALLSRRARCETAEIGVDAATRTLWVTRRGCFGWFPGRAVIAFAGDQPALRVVGGFVHTALWLELWASTRSSGRFRRLGPRFMVAGVDREDERRDLVAMVARCLGLRMMIERDHGGVYQVLLSSIGVEPPPPVRVARGYREPPVAIAPTFDRPPAFEAPADVPPLRETTASAELFETVRREGDAWIVETPRPSRRARLLWVSFGVVTHALVIVFAGVAQWRCVQAEADDWPSFLVLAGVAGYLTLLWKRGAVEPVRWRLLRDRLELAGIDPLRRGDAKLVAIELFQARGQAAWLLSVHAHGECYKLAETRGPRGTALESLAVEIARALDAPLRIDDGGSTRAGKRR